MLTNKSKAEGPRGKALINLTPTLFARKVRYVNQQKQSRRTPWKGFDKPDPNSFCSKGEDMNISHLSSKKVGVRFIKAFPRGPSALLLKDLTPWKGFDKPDPNSFCSLVRYVNQQKQKELGSGLSKPFHGVLLLCFCWLTYLTFRAKRVGVRL